VLELAGEGASPPRLFIMGRYVGGAEERATLAKSGKLRERARR
jgi:glutaredoxin domain-containing cysteine-rich protein 1